MADKTTAALVIAIIAVISVFIIGYSFYNQKDTDLSSLESDVLSIEIAIDDLDEKIDYVGSELRNEIADIDLDDDKLDDLEEDIERCARHYLDDEHDDYEDLDEFMSCLKKL